MSRISSVYEPSPMFIGGFLPLFEPFQDAQSSWGASIQHAADSVTSGVQGAASAVADAATGAVGSATEAVQKAGDWAAGGWGAGGGGSLSWVSFLGECGQKIEGTGSDGFCGRLLFQKIVVVLFLGLKSPLVRFLVESKRTPASLSVTRDGFLGGEIALLPSWRKWTYLFGGVRSGR